MAAEPDELTPEDAGADWPSNYFNYFTEVEEQFRKARGTGLFLMSPLDWALAAAWKESGVPLEAALRGIDAAFEKWRAQKRRGRLVNSLAYCTQAVVEEAEKMAGVAPAAPARRPAEAPFTLEELRAHLTQALARLTAPEWAGVREELERILAAAGEHYQNLEALEQRLEALEDKLIAVARARQTEADLFEARRELDAYLRPYRGKMTAPHLAMLEKQYLDRRLLERLDLPRLSLFYVR